MEVIGEGKVLLLERNCMCVCTTHTSTTVRHGCPALKTGDGGLRFTRVPISASVFCACAALAYHIVITQSHSYKHKEQDMDAQP